MYIAFYKTYRLTIASYVLIRDRELTIFWIQTSNIAEVHMVVSCLHFLLANQKLHHYAHNLGKVKGAYLYGFVHPCVCPSVRPFKILDRVLKFHRWIPHQK